MILLLFFNNFGFEKQPVLKKGASTPPTNLSENEAGLNFVNCRSKPKSSEYLVNHWHIILQGNNLL